MRWARGEIPLENAGGRILLEDAACLFLPLLDDMVLLVSFVMC